MSLVEKAIRMYELKEAIASHKKAVSVLDAELKHLQDEQIPDMMYSEDIPRISVGSIERTLYLHPMVRTTMSNRDACIQFLRDNGHGGIITETVPWQTLDALVKELGSEEFPEDIFTIREWDQARLRKS